MEEYILDKPAKWLFANPSYFRWKIPSAIDEYLVLRPQEGLQAGDRKMTFSCGNHDFDTDRCRKLKAKCIMGRPGCVLEGKVKLSPEILARLQDLKEERASRRKRRKI